MTGAEIKELIFSNGLKCWEVADELGIADCTFSRKLRKPFDKKQTELVKAAVQKLAAEKAAAAE